MSETFEIHQLLSNIFIIAWIIIFFILGALALFRFKISASGLLIGGSFILLALKIIIFRILDRLVMSSLRSEQESMIIFIVVSYLISFALYLTLAIGIGFIPKSLRRLAHKT